MILLTDVSHGSRIGNPVYRAGACISYSDSKTVIGRLILPKKAGGFNLTQLLKLDRLRASLRRRILRIGIVGANLIVLIGVVVLVIGHSTQTDATAPPVSSESSSAVATPQLTPLDQLASASIAETAAKMVGVGEVVAITNQADSERAQLSQASIANDTLAYKPQVVESAYKSNKDIKLYVVQSGDTMSKIATKFGVSSDSIRWSNDLSDNNVSRGMKLKIPPVEGIVYKVKNGDSPGSLALKYNVSKAKIIQYNDAELKGLKPGELIILPGATRTQQITSSYSSSSTVTYRQPSYGYNGYDYGYCTWWVANERQKAGNPLPVGLGNASSWPYWAKVFGLSYGYSPRVGAAAVTSTSGEGHVAYVVQVNSDGSIWVSQMNSSGQRSLSDSTPVGGWNVVSYRHWSASSANSFFYIY